MKKDQEPEQLASIAISRDEIAGRQRQSGPLRAPTAHASTPKLLWVISMTSVLISVGIFIHLQQVKVQSDKQLKALTILQERLSSTDEQANLSVDAIKILLKDQDHEIRKLWDVANKRNKSQISKNKGRIDQQNKLMTQYSSKVEQLGKNAESLEKNLQTKIKESGQAQQSSIQSLKNSVTEVESKLGTITKGIPKNLAKTLSDHGKGIKAMDKTRLQLLKKIKSLEAQIKALNAKAASTPLAK